jgi:branched-chain amino acid transport system substrate-binding protein
MARESSNRATQQSWTMPLGFRHALFEVATDVLKRAKALEPGAIREAIAATSYESVVGPIQWKQVPAPGVCTTSLVGGQWQDTGGRDLELRIVTNKGAANIPVNGTMQAI